MAAWPPVTAPLLDSTPTNSPLPEQPGGAGEIEGADGEDDEAGPLAEAVVGHALEHERGEIGAAQDVAEGLGDRLGADRGLAVEHALLEEHVEEHSPDPGEELHEGRQHPGQERNAAPFDVRRS